MACSTVRAEHRGWMETVVVRFLGPEQAAQPCAQLTPSRRSSTIAEESSPYVLARGPGDKFGLTEEKNDLKSGHTFLAGNPATVLYLYKVTA